MKMLGMLSFYKFLQVIRLFIVIYEYLLRIKRMIHNYSKYYTFYKSKVGYDSKKFKEPFSFDKLCTIQSLSMIWNIHNKELVIYLFMTNKFYRMRNNNEWTSNKYHILLILNIQCLNNIWTINMQSCLLIFFSNLSFK